MKKLIVSLVAIATILTGCKSVPSENRVTALSTAIGAASAAACKIANVSTNDIEVIKTVLETAKEFTPEGEATFEETWTPIITAQIDIMYIGGKLTDDEKELATKILIACSRGVDWMFDKHPTWKQYENIVSCAIDGFVKGFDYIIGKKLTFAASPDGNMKADDVEIDGEAYRYFSATYKF